MRKNFNLVSTAVAFAVAGSMVAGGAVLAQSNDTKPAKPKAPTAANASADARNPDASNTQIDQLNYSSGVKRDSRMSLDSPSRGMVGQGQPAPVAATPAPIDTAAAPAATSSTYAADTPVTPAPVDTTSTTPAQTTTTTAPAYDTTPAPALAPRTDRN